MPADPPRSGESADSGCVRPFPFSASHAAGSTAETVMHPMLILLSIDLSLSTFYDGDMRIYGIEPDGKFREYVPTPFQMEHEEVTLEDWLEENPDGILEDGKLLIIGRQVNTNLGTTIDPLALDRDGSAVVIELKRDRTPRDTLAQALEYASFAGQLSADELEGILQSYMSDESLALAEYHREYFALAPDDAVAFNKDQ